MEDENDFNPIGMSGTTEEAWPDRLGKGDTVTANGVKSEQMSHLYPCGESEVGRNE
ncbi:hypothetical protein QA612_06725 [Evansella sp. AB-P1]|uniref:hypothetical protein n=1 Tax=Evansella sp. AB-P1 TaxID=3037653 RepID=UPI00241DB547|nr:hypothetical protein [Evansella sp. AB-P1]MDG5787181.1 hypothetical protein [Evansella sp. AB-P1]